MPSMAQILSGRLTEVAERDWDEVAGNTLVVRLETFKDDCNRRDRAVSNVRDSLESNQRRPDWPGADRGVVAIV